MPDSDAGRATLWTFWEKALYIFIIKWASGTYQIEPNFENLTAVKTLEIILQKRRRSRIICVNQRKMLHGHILPHNNYQLIWITAWVGKSGKPPLLAFIGIKKHVACFLIVRCSSFLDMAKLLSCSMRRILWGNKIWKEDLMMGEMQCSNQALWTSCRRWRRKKWTYKLLKKTRRFSPLKNFLSLISMG